MKRFMLVGILSVLFLFQGMAAANTAYEQAKIECLSAWVSLAAYNDRIGLLARSELMDEGWAIKQYQESYGGVDAKFFVVDKADPVTGDGTYLLVITGTESQKDIHLDLNIHKVFFGGTTRETFFTEAQRAKVVSTDPMVHKGFDDYVRAAFFTKEYDGITFGEYIAKILKEKPGAKLYITGHSLGGAVATLASARLSMLGVPANQIEVISFGAPAVGNETFARMYGDKLQLDRIVIAGDPVKGVLQAVSEGYVQFGSPKEWQANRNSEKFKHEMVVYVDAALRNFYDVRREAEAAGERIDDEKDKTEPELKAGEKVYIAPFAFKLDEKIADDRTYMEEALKDNFRERIPGCVFSKGIRGSVREECEKARAAGCQYVVIEDFLGKRIQKEEYNFAMMMQEEIYDVDGHFLGGQETATNTGEMTPIEAILRAQTALKASRERTLFGKNYKAKELRQNEKN